MEKKYSLINTYKEYNFSYINVKMIINCQNKWKVLLQENKITYIPHIAKGLKTLDKNIYLKHYLCKSFEEYSYKLFVRGEQRFAKWNRKIEDFLKMNPDLKDKKEDLQKILNKYSNNIVTANDYPSIYHFECNDWSMTESQLKDIIYELEFRKPNRIIELGSRVSTNIFETYKNYNNCIFYSIEHNKNFLTKNTILFPLEENTSIEINCRIYESCNKYNGLENWLNNQDKFDFILIDGPIGFGFRENYNYQRVQLLSFILLDKISDNTIVYFHDAERLNARTTLDEFEQLLGLKGFVFQKITDNMPHKQLVKYIITKLK